MADKKERRKSAFAEFFQGIRRGSETDIRPAPPKGSVFGQPVDPNASTIHWLPQLTSSWLRKNALGTEGIFRVSPSQEKLDALRAEIEKQKDKIEIKSSENPHVVAGIYKLFWRELPEPLTSFAAYDTFLNIGLDANATDAERISAMRRALGALPPGVLAHVEHLADFLHACSKNDANRMGVMNLALIFAPLFFRAKVEEIKKMMREAPVVNMLTELLIGNKEDLFKTVLLPNPPPKAGDGPMGYQIRKLTRSNTASSASELSLVKTPSSTSVSADAVPPLNVEAADKDKEKEKDKDKDARSRSTTSGAMHSPVPQQRQLILSEARRANRRSVAVMSTSSQDTILQTSSSHPHPSVHTHFADVKSPRDAALLSSSSAHPAGAAPNGASANGYASKADASAPLSPMRSRATVHSTPRDTSPRGPDARPQATSPPARPSVSVRPESPRGSASGAYAPSRPTHAPRPESPRSSGPGATVTSPASARRSEAGMSPRSSVAGAPPGASAPMSPSRTGAMDVPRSSPPTAPLPSSPPPKSTQLGGSGGTGNAHAKPAPPNTSPPRRRKMSQPDVPVLVQNTPENLETRITALARGFRATLQDRPSTEEVLALAKLLSAAQKGLMGTHLEPTMYISKPTATSAAALSAELSMLRDRAVDGWEELTLRTAAKAKGAKGGTEADLHALSGVLKLLQFYQRTV